MPILLWLMLWLGISPGEPKALLHPESPISFANDFRALVPLIAAGAALIMIGAKVARVTPREFYFFGPLALAAAYGLVGFAATLKSPDGSSAFWWAALYLSVPLVLWCVVWSGNPLDQLRRLINVTWFGIILITMTLFVMALLRLDIIDNFTDPTQLIICDSPGWIDITGNRLRETGVGRYAAVAGIVAISGLGQGKWRPVWLAVLLISFILLLDTGARGAFGGFVAGASLVIIVYLMRAGKKALLAGTLVAIVIGSTLLGTGIFTTFMENCVLRSELGVTVSHPAISVIASDSSKPAPSTQTSAGVQTSSPELGAPSDNGSGLALLLTDDLTEEPSVQEKTYLISPEFFNFSGRTAIWSEGWRLVTRSPIIGFGFNSDRLLLGTQMHNSVMQALLQAGFLGAIPFVGSVILAWAFFFRVFWRLSRLTCGQIGLVIQCGGILAFLTARSFPESTGAFFGVDWLLLALVFMYLQMVNYGRRSVDPNGPYRKLEGA